MTFGFTGTNDAQFIISCNLKFNDRVLLIVSVFEHLSAEFLTFKKAVVL